MGSRWRVSSPSRDSQEPERWREMAGEGQQGQQGELHVGSAGWVGGEGGAGKP